QPSSTQAPARFVEIGQRVHTERLHGDHAHHDRQAERKCTQLLELFAALEGSLRRRDEALQRGTSVDVETDVMEVRRRARWNWSAAEIVSATYGGCPGERLHRDLHDTGPCELVSIMNLAGERRHVESCVN